MAVASSTDFDPWREIEGAALDAFKGTASRRAPGLVSVLRRSLRYAKIDNEAKEIVIDRRAFFFGILAVGALDKPSASYGTSATWLADIVKERSPSDPTRILQKSLTGTDEIIGARRRNFAVVASVSMKSVGTRATSISRLTVNRRTADLRHFLAAFLEDRDRSLKAFGDIGWKIELNGLFSLKRTLCERIGTYPEANENIQAWQEILIGNELAPIGALRREVAGFSSDSATLPFQVDEDDVLSGDNDEPDRDPLELKADVRAFARLICLEEADPPLSIGVFGGWGSGKSTFMQLLEQAVAALAAGQKDAPPSPVGSVGSREPRFISNVVQIRFNAWHFADANLWASLTAEFFDQLRAGGYAGSGKAIHRRLVERVNDHIHTLTSDAATARKALAESEEALQEKQKARDTAVAQARSEKSKRIGQTLADAVTKAFNDHKSDLNEMGRRTYYDNPGKDIEDFVDLVKGVQTIGGQLRTLGSYISARGARLLIVAASFATMAAAGTWLWPGDLSAGATQFNAVGVFGFLAGLGGLARAVLPGIKMIGELAKSTAGFAKELDEATASEIKAVAEADDALQRAAAEAQARRAAAERANKALARYIDPKAGTSNPPRLLRYMLEDDPDTRALEKEIGLISRVRRLFQAIDEIVAEEKSKATSPNGEGSGPDPDVPDRIVIYIDDLDRCTPSQVYAVLQAVHLLLAFRLFVVVVGVDVAWVEHSLTKELGPVDGAIGSRSLAIRYLEKIFQLPFWLQRLSTQGSDGGSYGRFVRLMLEGNLAKDVPEPPEAMDKISVHGMETPSNGQPLSGGPDGLTESSTSEGVESGLEEALSTVQLTLGEVNFLAGEAIGRLAGGEPRTVKRFINIYRIIRARLDPSARQTFLGEDSSPAQYPVVAVLVAMETGQSEETVSNFYRKLVETPIPDVSGMDFEPIAAAFESAREQRQGVAVSANECLQLSMRARRYSFNRAL